MQDHSTIPYLSALPLAPHHTLLGQMQDHSAIPYLEATLENPKLDPIVRHEVAAFSHKIRSIVSSHCFVLLYYLCFLLAKTLDTSMTVR
jgi:hypothetical protein